MSARRADGMDENDAWQSARNSFGDADAMGRELAREWKRAPRVETVGTPLTKHETGKIMDVRASIDAVSSFLWIFLSDGCGARS